MTHPAASYHPPIARRLIALGVLVTLALTACGSQRSTLPPAPGASGTIALSELAHHPEVYADATVATVGTVARTRAGGKRLYVLEGGHGTRIALEPSSFVAADLGRRVRVRGVFTVTFELGYEILVSRIAAA